MKTRTSSQPEEIRYVHGASSLGTILVGTSAKGVAAILIDDEADSLIDDLQHRFPKARLVPGNARDDGTLARVIAFIEAPEAELDLPLDLRGTPFQQRVWQALRDIPLGQTSTYTEIARKIGVPRAIRAVGNACATNDLSLAVPCHRVLRQGRNDLGKYRWGPKRKRILLDREAKAQPRGDATIG
jgi:AraC family transcriptional regulator of adaptative response/methylated-DNA-[protein]-cysteine methyltransferase